MKKLREHLQFHDKCHLHETVLKTIKKWLEQPKMTIEKALKELEEK